MRRIIVAITGASGRCTGSRRWVAARVPDVETHLVMTRGRRGPPSVTRPTAASPTCVRSPTSCTPTATWAHRSRQVVPDGRDVVAPCSVKTLSGIASSYDESLVVRAADVVLKEPDGWCSCCGDPVAPATCG
ncbi:hypothetical protein HBB16_03995 [Pseudonocardia sp. MCCB 268]|nr:hypothetical protein [Pseudonocardia cytotoxica]